MKSENMQTNEVNIAEILLHLMFSFRKYSNFCDFLTFLQDGYDSDDFM